MPSSISNSNDRLPDGPWGRTWLLTAVLAIVLVFAVESYWRGQGQRTPMVVDDKDNWSLQREKLSTNQDKTVALLGMSRIQMGFATQVFYDRYPHYTLGNVCIQGLAPFATLRDLANDESFRGVAIVELTEPGVLRSLNEDQQSYVEYFHKQWRFDKRLVRKTANWIQSNLVMTNPTLSINEVVTQFIEGGWPRPNYLITFADRSRLADFAKADMDKLWQFLTGIINGAYLDARKNPAPAMTREQWLSDVAEFEKQVRIIQARGGKVVFVRYPTSGPVFVEPRHEFPRGEFWDLFAQHTSAATIHYEDVPTLRGFPTPDWSHLGGDDAVKFTGALLDELEKRGVLEARK